MTAEPTEEPQLSDVLKDRREKLGRIRDAGIEPFPHEFSDREEIGEGVYTEVRLNVEARIGPTCASMQPGRRHSNVCDYDCGGSHGTEERCQAWPRT